MRVRVSAVVVVGLLAANVLPADAQPPTCTTTGATMNCTFPAPSGSTPWTSSGNNIYSTNSGNAGIGTATPDRKLPTRATGPTQDNYLKMDGWYASYYSNRYFEVF